MSIEQDKSVVIEALKALIAQGKFTCMKCRFPISGDAIRRIDVEGRKVWYVCPNKDCYNHTHEGYRTFRGLMITLPASGIPEDLVAVKAPPPPEPEDVDYDSDDNEAESDAENEI